MTDGGIVIGIDLGTTYSLVSVLEGDRPVVLPNALGELLTPSAVSVDDDGAILVGAAARARLEADGFHAIGDIRRADPRAIARSQGDYGLHLWRLAHGEDRRKVTPDRETKSVSAETTFNEDISDAEELTAILWKLSERVSARLKAAEFSGLRVTLKLKSADFKSRTRSRTLDSPTRLASRIFETGRELLQPEAKGERFRLIGIGVSGLSRAGRGDFTDLIDQRRAGAEQAMDRLRQRYGARAVVRGLNFEHRDEENEP